ncbi:low temperature requirement protein A [Micromonospora sp. DT47]|uniref:low temperature requirement protein A n=1 Tax=Micromonospora sp. DT47 TaxID=3393431 RepID=UPI003CFB4B08
MGRPNSWPGLGRTPKSKLPNVAEHLSERYRQFFIIALGELILVTGLALRGRPQQGVRGVDRHRRAALADLHLPRRGTVGRSRRSGP